MTQRIVQRDAYFFDSEIQHVELRSRRRTIARYCLRLRRVLRTALRVAGVVRLRFGDARETNDEILHLERNATGAASFWDGTDRSVGDRRGRIGGA